MLSPYFQCKEPLKLKHYMTGAIMPAIIPGFSPAIFANVIGSIPLLVFGAFLTLRQ